MAEGYSVEHTIRVYHDSHGYHVSIGPDADGLDLCQLTYSEDGVKDRGFTMPWEMAELVANAIFDLAPSKKRANP